MKKLISVVSILVLYFSVSYGETFPGRPMGDTLLRYFDDTLPAILIHMEYTDSANFDTTERIIPYFDEYNRVTDIFKYTKQNGDSLFVKSKHTYFTYTQDGIITSATEDARSSGKLFPYTQELYTYQDTTRTVITKLSMIPGYPVENFIKKIYYDIDSNGIAGIRKYTYTKKTQSSGYWFESSRYVEYYNEKSLLIDSILDYSIFTIDTLKRIYKRSGTDTIVENHSEYINDTTEVNAGSDTTIIDSEKRPIFKSYSKYNDNTAKIVPYKHEFFTYNKKNATFISAKYDTLKGEFVNSYKEEHLNNSKNKRIRIVYYNFDTTSSTWNIASKDTLIYDESAINFVEKSSSEIHSSARITQLNREIKISYPTPVFIKSIELYSLSGRKIKSVEYSKKQSIFNIEIPNHSNGILILEINGTNRISTKKILKY